MKDVDFIFGLLHWLPALSCAYTCVFCTMCTEEETYLSSVSNVCYICQINVTQHLVNRLTKKKKKKKAFWLLIWNPC